MKRYPLGWAVVKYTNYEDAEAAVTAINGKLLLGSGRNPVKLWFAQLKRNRIRNEAKCGIFRRWLEDTFGLERLRSGSGILDVAGGNGALSFELINLSDIRSTVIDPRPLRLDRTIRRLRMGLYHRNAVFNKYNRGVKQNDPFKVPPHIKLMFETWDCSHYPHSQSTSSTGGPGSDAEADQKCTLPTALLSEENLTRAMQISEQCQWGKRGLNGHEDDHGSDSDGNDDTSLSDISSTCSMLQFGQQYTENESLIEDIQSSREIIRQSSILVGMHPDQAAQAIVDFAIRNNKPFACIPCCVYSSEPQFRGRKLPDGTPVSNYDTLIKFLQSRAPGIKVCDLPFEGKNKVVYKL
mmetsp:Transcript_34673/g.54156  ORF Transcript_34673/g.54156 Transcript_34673/m.54156 type:complete len:352 (-) Transcript_34673:1286-2341(-)